MNKKYTLVGLILILLVLATALILQDERRKTVSEQNNHSWANYQNSQLGFSLEYPSDIATPNQPGINNPAVVSFSAPNNYGTPVIEVSVNVTDATDTQSYLAQNPQLNNDEQTFTDIAGAYALKANGGSLCPDCSTLIFVYKGHVYDLNINLPQVDKERVQSSFKFTDTSS